MSPKIWRLRDLCEPGSDDAEEQVADHAAVVLDRAARPTRPQMVLSVVLFPAPLAPSRATIAPVHVERDGLRACSGP